MPMKKQWIQTSAVVLLVLAAVLLIAQRLIPVELEHLMPKDFAPESCHVGYFGPEGYTVDADLTEAETDQLWELLESLNYRYNGRVPGGVMKGLLYHVTLTDLELPEQVNLFVTTQLGVVYLNDREYEMVGDTEPLLEFLGQLR